MSQTPKYEQVVTLERAREIAHKIIKFLEAEKFDMVEAYTGLKLVSQHIEKACDIKGMEIFEDISDKLEGPKSDTELN